ncbi:hypothetical protein EUX98_g7132 [Antrodiella citrinella]|uniref:Uncharacterized protein n=1 Tax=Antrodiella citrinella TaxID=2447956 RepID=A0A4S4MUN4_9APHY|nr:hypothetical protein EUX98_g7132 [Antrodiella citrinella]
MVGANTGKVLISTNNLNMFTAPSLGPGAGLHPDAQARTEETRKLKDGTRIPLLVFILYMKRARRNPDYLTYVQSEACAATSTESN